MYSCEDSLEMDLQMHFVLNNFSLAELLFVFADKMYFVLRNFSPEEL